jgi:hypothetical protein
MSDAPDSKRARQRERARARRRKKKSAAQREMFPAEGWEQPLIFGGKEFVDPKKHPLQPEPPRDP